MVKLYFHSRAAPAGIGICPPRVFCGAFEGATITAPGSTHLR
jgi:hypothetical protein